MFTADQQQLIKNKLQQFLKEDADFAVIYHKVRKAFDASGLPAHNWEHIFRDICNAIVIGEAEKVDMRIVLPAITMHDIGFLYGATSKAHAAVGAEKLAEFLADISVTYTGKELTHITACIRTHKGSVHDEQPQTLEAKVVADADLLEKFGPFGVYQNIRTKTEFNYSIKKIVRREHEIMNFLMMTETGRRLAEPQRHFVKDFFQALAQVYSEYPSID